MGVGDRVRRRDVPGERAEDPPARVARAGVDQHVAHEVRVERVGGAAGEEVEVLRDLFHTGLYGTPSPYRAVWCRAWLTAGSTARTGSPPAWTPWSAAASRRSRSCRWRATLGVTRGSFYWHFGSRDELLEAVLERWEDEHSDADARRRSEDRGPARAPARDPRPRRAEAAVVLRAPARRRRTASRSSPRRSSARRRRGSRRSPTAYRGMRACPPARRPPQRAARLRRLRRPRADAADRRPARSAPASAARSPTTSSRRSCPDGSLATLRARCRTPSTEQTLAERLLAGDRRALARAITLVESDDPRGWDLVREVYPHTGQAAIVGLTGAPGAGKSTLISALAKLRRAAGPHARGALDRPVLAVHPRRAARRPHPPDRPLPRPGRLHPLDGQPRRARRAQRGGAPGGAADGRGGPRRTSSSRPSASARPRSTSSITPTRSCSC